MLIHLAAALAVGAFRVCRMQDVSAYRVLDFEVAYVRMDDHETLIDQQGAERKPQMNHFAFLRSRPGSQVPDYDRQGLECL